jgi:predicted  nucleic acid-binding Zn-ribbon protein
MKDFFNMFLLEEDDGANPQVATPEQAPGQTPEPQEEPKFTQKQLNDLIAKNKSDTQAKLLKQMGVESFDDVKEGLKQLKEMQLQGKSKAEQLEIQNKEMAQKLEELSNGKNSAESKLAAIMKGVDPKKLDRALKLANAYEGETAEEKIEAMLEEFPELKKGQQAEGPKINIGGSVNNPGVSSAEQEKAELRKIFLGK